MGIPAGATRHQLLVDDRIPYTSHNSSACLAWRSADGNVVADRITEYAGRFLEKVCPPDADPGLAVAIPGRLTETACLLVDFGQRAKREVLRTQEARDLAAEVGVHLSGHGGTQDGDLRALTPVDIARDGMHRQPQPGEHPTAAECGEPRRGTSSSNIEDVRRSASSFHTNVFAVDCTEGSHRSHRHFRTLGVVRETATLFADCR